MSFIESLRIEERNGWVLKCPFCSSEILYTTLSNWDTPIPFFYAEESNDVLLRDSDIRKVREVYSRNKSAPSLSELEALWETFLESAPRAPYGERFSLWANVKCPHCGKAMPYNNGVKDANIRIHDPKIILIDGAVVLGDTPEESWRVKVIPSLP